MRVRSIVFLSLASSVSGASCAAPQRPAPVAVASSTSASAPTTILPKPATDRAVARSAVHEVVSQGLGMFLRRVDFDDQPVFLAGRFHGFRIASLRDAQFWNGIDLKPGDVVTSVNGFPIERPEQAQMAFDSLEVASELRVSFERSGATRELVYAIVDR